MIVAYCKYQQGRNFSPATIRRRRLTLMAFARFLAPAGLEQAELADVEQFLATKPSARTRHAYLSDLRTFYRWAIRRGLLDENPCKLYEPIRLPKVMPRPLGAEVHQALLTGRRRTRLMVALGLFAGLRAAEIANLDASDIALHNDPPLLVVRNGKGGKDRVVPLHPHLAAMLEGLPAGPLFPNRDGRPITPGACSKTIGEHLRRCGIDATAHQLRHTFGTELAARLGGDLLALAGVMGHSSTETSKGYAAWTGQAAAEIARMYEVA